jgi:hypothetical protein
MREPQTQPAQDKDGGVGSRALLGAAVIVAVLGGVALVSLGTPPGAAETGAQVVVWFGEHRDSVQWFVWAITVATPLIALVFALLCRLLPAPHRDVFLIGAVTFVATTAVYAWTWAGLALHADRLEPATARAVLDVAIFYGPVLTGTTITMMAPVTLLALRGRAGLPRWLGGLGAVAFAEQAVETVTIFGSTGLTQPGGAMNMQLGAALTLGWMLAFALWGASGDARRERRTDGQRPRTRCQRSCSASVNRPTRGSGPCWVDIVATVDRIRAKHACDRCLTRG